MRLFCWAACDWSVCCVEVERVGEGTVSLSAAICSLERRDDGDDEDGWLDDKSLSVESTCCLSDWSRGGSAGAVRDGAVVEREVVLTLRGVPALRRCSSLTRSMTVTER